MFKPKQRDSLKSLRIWVIVLIIGISLLILFLDNLALFGDNVLLSCVSFGIIFALIILPITEIISEIKKFF